VCVCVCVPNFFLIISLTNVIIIKSIFVENNERHIIQSFINNFIPYTLLLQAWTTNFFITNKKFSIKKFRVNNNLIFNKHGCTAGLINLSFTELSKIPECYYNSCDVTFAIYQTIDYDGDSKKCPERRNTT